ncbi:UPF0236 family transposase-like protein [Anaerotalea alkaliphila]|uniref:ISLre2 family transposase n=1 Tax=Anaerotalea alkaliphila TaxID=2662126 RepID=A0A7X5HXZ1_9FIRM|nr:UPF0236 family protein [Anaerotalea alkaliphila]NDL68724.1 hypothetical protein [Anaerotalea alkaliphila]
MNTILSEKVTTFKEFEKRIFEEACNLARKMTEEVLQQLDDRIAEARDKTLYRDKGGRKTSIKTIYGTVEYSRRVYERTSEEGKKEYVYLLDQEMQMERIGLLSTNLAEKIVEGATKLSYRATADEVSSMTGQSISHGGAWNLVQTLGEKLDEEEKGLVAAMKQERLQGEEETPILFEEMDGIYLNMQRKDRPAKKGKREMKVSMAYNLDSRQHVTMLEV